jgi:hypothetical protein
MQHTCGFIRYDALNLLYRNSNNLKATENRRRRRGFETQLDIRISLTLKRTQI